MVSNIINKEKIGLLIGIIGDEDTVTGFLLSGIGERNDKSKNFFTPKIDDVVEIQTAFDTLINREDMGIVLISQVFADQIRDSIMQYNKSLPTVLEIPSKEHKYEMKNDSIMVKCFRQLRGQDITG